MKILFIGGTGRLSRDVAHLAVEQGNDVYLLTRGSKSRALYVDDRYHMLYSDVANSDQVNKVLENLHFDVIIDFITFTTDELKRNLKNFNNHYSQYIFISTATVYEKQDEFEIIRESSTAIGNKKWSYSWNKAECENYLKEYFANKTEKYTIVRPYVTYSDSRIPYPIVTPSNSDEYSLIRRVKLGKPIPTFNGGKTITTLTHTHDFARGVVGLFGNERAFNQAYHITADKTTTWGKVLDAIEVKLGIPIVRFDLSVEEISRKYPFYKELLTGDKAHQMVFDNSKIKSAINNYEFEIDIIEGINRVIEFYNEHPELQLIDYYWDGKIDRMCHYYVCRKTLCSKSVSLKDKIKYLRGRFGLIDIFVKVLDKVIRT